MYNYVFCDFARRVSCTFLPDLVVIWTPSSWMTDAMARTPEFTFKERRAASLGFNTTIPGFFLLFLAFIGFILATFIVAFIVVALAFLS